MLYPQSNVRRSVTSLNGIWKFKTVEENFLPDQPILDGMLMAVPASYNDLVTDKNLRDHVGKVAYETEFSVPEREGAEYRLRIGATSHKSEVYLNGKKIGEGINGYYPIDVALEGLKAKNRLTVVIDNCLTYHTLPMGERQPDKLEIKHDFYNFTGIHRDVVVYSVPQKRIDDIVIHTVVDGDYEKIKVDVTTNCERIEYKILDKLGREVVTTSSGEITIANPVLWDTENPYLYTLVVTTETDVYEERFGIRKVTYDDKGLYLNDKLVYFKGFGMHEDFFLLGKGNSPAVNIRNFELLKWTNANSIRTSHYPYSEEIMDLCDEYGIMVIDEVPAVGVNHWNPTFDDEKANGELQKLHKELIKLLIERDKNHPCVVMMSVANEPATFEKEAHPYFAEIIGYTRMLTDLPITIAEETKWWETEEGGSTVGDLVDFTCLNRYFGWYEKHGDLRQTRPMLLDEFKKWHDKFGKPIIVTEFGADTIEGLHALPSIAFSEEYQKEFIEENCNTFDEMPYVVGEHVWNFADFKTKQGTIRIRGNRKGVFTKEREPKAVAFYLKDRWSKKNEP